MTAQNAYPKRLIETDLPIKRISEHARKEKSIRHGHISTLHIWWARRPLAACRAVICASLWPDPTDPICPQRFRNESSRLITKFARNAITDRQLAAHCSHDNWVKWQALASARQLDPQNETHWNALRTALLDFIADFSDWDNATVVEYLETSQALTQAAHEALGGDANTSPLVVDPFAGGGSIPLEALRVGADAFASDLNPVAVLLNKVLLEYVPKFGDKLAEEVRKWGEWVEGEAKRELGRFYPDDCSEAKPTAYVWARTILSEGPSPFAEPIEVPLIRSMWLSKKKGREFALGWERRQDGQIKTETRSVIFADGTNQIVRRPILKVFRPKSVSDVEHGTSRGGAATCPITGYTTPVENVRKQLEKRRGGASDARMLCVVTAKAHETGKNYRIATDQDIDATNAASDELRRRPFLDDSSISLVPDGKLNHLRGFFNVVLYGMTTWGDLFTPRQALVLTTLTRLVRGIEAKFDSKQDAGLSTAVRACLGLAVSRHADINASLAMWHTTRELITHVFGRQALPMVWDFAEANSFSDASGSFSGGVDWIARVIAQQRIPKSGTVEQASATCHPLPADAAEAVVTDPPYYAAIPYADLSDFFYSWLKRSVGDLYPELFGAELSPKEQECVSLSHRAAMYRNKDKNWFESTMRLACAECRRYTKPSGIGVFVFANKETSGWEAMLGALVSSGWIITAAWPIDTEMGTRLRARNSAVLASSVHLVCRPRGAADDPSQTSEVGDWRDVLAELPKRIEEWMPRLASEGIVGADAIFACLGPALEIFSRYAHVEKASGEIVTLNEYLEYVWAAVAKEALSMIFVGGDATGLEEDARLTAMWLWTLSTGVEGEVGEGNQDEATDEGEKEVGGVLDGFVLEYDAARKIAQGLGAHLEQLTSIVEISGDKARLIPLPERARHLFGKNEGTAPTKRKGKPKQLSLLEALNESDEDESGVQDKNVSRLGASVLDRIHQSMILFGAGRGEALKRFLVTDGAGQDQRFWRLAQALSALYPKGTDERRWVEGVLARKKGLGF
ncbi:MAG: DUF1156 domain-containing protein [Terriglobia bacterium]